MPPGSDGTLLSLGLALEKLLGRMPGPPQPPGCIGCTAHVANQTVGRRVFLHEKSDTTMQPAFLDAVLSL